MKKIAILGSTGSIGKSLLKLLKKKDFEIILLTANKNYKELYNQTKKYKLEYYNYRFYLLFKI